PAADAVPLLAKSIVWVTVAPGVETSGHVFVTVRFARPFTMVGTSSLLGGATFEVVTARLVQLPGAKATASNEKVKVLPFATPARVHVIVVPVCGSNVGVVSGAGFAVPALYRRQSPIVSVITRFWVPLLGPNVETVIT